MAKEKIVVDNRKKWHRHVSNNSAPGVIYGLGVLGAIIYYLQHATTFWMGIIGILKAIVWPAFIVFRLHEFFKL